MLTITSPDALTAAEIEMVIRLGESQNYIGEMQVARHSHLQFDLRVFGERIVQGEDYAGGMHRYAGFLSRSWLPLACLRMWRDDPAIGPRFFDDLQLSDWSFVRDQSSDVHWHNFEFIRARVHG